MYRLAGEWLPMCEPDPLPLSERITHARRALVEETGRDFGFDLKQWHEYLVQNHKDGYCWSNQHRSILSRIREAETDPEWRHAVAALAAEQSPGNPPAVEGR
jgi:hypothetical protein